MEALHDLVKSGKVRYIGASSMEAWRFAKMQHTAVTLQSRVSLPRAIGLQGITPTPWSSHRGNISRSSVEETMEALHDLVKSGKVRYIGASSMEAWRFAKMQDSRGSHQRPGLHTGATSRALLPGKAGCIAVAS
jgi:aryl-alcohol dehydrogenase-like predicted oxidoreductase